MLHTPIKCLVFLLLLAAGSLQAQQPLNFDFEQKSVEGVARPWGWSPFQVSPTTTTSLDSAVVYEGKYSLRFRNTAAGNGEHELAYWISPHELTGKKVILNGWVKSAMSAGTAQITLAAYGDTGLIKEVKSVDFQGVTVWKPVQLSFQCDAPAHSWFLIINMNGGGEIWFDDFRLLVNGEEKRSLEVADDISPEQQLWLQKNCTALAGVRPFLASEKADFDDLKAFQKAVGKARIIALGESTHGTSEFFQLKHRLLQYGVQELGVRVFAIEANQLEVEKINRYVRDNVGSAEKAISVMFSVWNTREMLALIKWMRAYNQLNPTQMVSFAGFDLQDPSLPMDSLSQFLAQWAPDLQPEVDTLQYNYREAWRAQYYPQAPDKVRGRWQENARKVWLLISGKAPQWLAKVKTPAEKDRVEWAVQNARVALQAAEIAYSQSVTDRDTFMAENIRWIDARQPPGTRMIVWAHDSHIARSDNPDNRYNYHGGNSMGKYLSRMYGKDYRAFGFFTGQGQYSATISYSNHKVVPVDEMPAPRGSFDAALHQIAVATGAKQLFLNLQPAMDLKKNEWLFKPRPVRFVGYATSDYDFGAMMSVPHQFDGIFFVDKTTASNKLR